MIIRITTYKRFAAVVAIQAGPDAAAVMGRFPEARWNPADRVFIARADRVDAFRSIAEPAGALVLDERESDDTGGPPGQAPPLPECRSCGQPAAKDAQPATCPTCGARWKPITFAGVSPIDRGRHIQRARGGQC